MSKWCLNEGWVMWVGDEGRNEGRNEGRVMWVGDEGRNEGRVMRVGAE